MVHERALPYLSNKNKNKRADEMKNMVLKEEPRFARSIIQSICLRTKMCTHFIIYSAVFILIKRETRQHDNGYIQAITNIHMFIRLLMWYKSKTTNKTDESPINHSLQNNHQVVLIYSSDSFAGLKLKYVFFKFHNDI